MPKIYSNERKNPDGSYSYDVEEVENINFYLLNGPNIIVKPRTLPLSRAVPKIIKGNQPTDGGYLMLTEEEKNYFIKKYPQDKKFIKRIMGSEEFIHNKKRFCLWLVNATPDEIKNNKFIYERVKKCKEDRLKGGSDKKKLADTPHLFRETRNPKSAIVIPAVSSELRKYIPIDFVDDSVILTNLNLMIPDAEIWHFGILTSNVHMIWTKTVCGRLTSRIRYSAKIVYNNFVWMKMEFIDYAELILAAEKILKVRKNYPDASLADLYDEITMPRDLREAHKNLDKIVMKIYGYDDSWSEEEIAVDLLQRYKFMTDYLQENNLKQNTRQNFDEDEDFEE